MTRHHGDLRLPAFPRPYPVKRDKRSPHPVERISLHPLLWLVLLLQGLTLLLLVAGPSPQRPLPSMSQPGLAALHDIQAIHSPFHQ